MKTIEQLTGCYLAAILLNGAAPSWTRAHRFYLLAFARWQQRNTGATYPADLRPEFIVAWQQALLVKPNELTGLPLKPVTRWTYTSAAHRFCRWLYRGGYITGLVIESFPPLSPPATPVRPTLSHTAMRQFLRKLPHGTPEQTLFCALAEFLYSTGARISEALSIDLGDVDFEHRQVRLLGKGRKERMVPLGHLAARMTESYVKGIRPLLLRDPAQKAVWLDQRGRRMRYDWFRRRWSTLARQLPTPFKVTAHLFRRACTTELVRGGADLWAVKEILGHDDFESLKYYVYTDIASLKKMHARFHPRDNGMDDSSKS